MANPKISMDEKSGVVLDRAGMTFCPSLRKVKIKSAVKVNFMELVDQFPCQICRRHMHWAWPFIKRLKTLAFHAASTSTEGSG